MTNSILGSHPEFWQSKLHKLPISLYIIWMERIVLHEDKSQIYGTHLYFIRDADAMNLTRAKPQ
jgi:hypothetical protein